MKKFIIIVLILISLGLGGLVAYYYIPYSSSGVRAGQLNYVMYKGVVFKTYEGKLIQTGIKSGTTGGVESNAFEFSIKDKEVFDQLSLLAGKHVILHYKEYYGSLPWRGYTKFIVDSIIDVEPGTSPNGLGIDPNAFITE